MSSPPAGGSVIICTDSYRYCYLGLETYIFHFMDKPYKVQLLLKSRIAPLSAELTSME